MEEPISPRLRAFLKAHIDSVAQLEALLLLRGALKPLPLAVVAGALYASESAAAGELARLAARGLVASAQGTWFYTPPSADVAAVVEELASTYARAVVAVTRIVHGAR